MTCARYRRLRPDRCRRECGAGARLGDELSKELVSQEKSNFCEEDVAGNDHHVGDDDGLCGGAAYSLGATADGQAFVAADRREDEAVDERLHHALHDVGEIEGVDGAGPEFDGAEAERKDRGNAASEKTDKVRKYGEQR